MKKSYFEYKKHKKHVERDTKSRCRAWLDGDRLKMWKEAKHAAGQAINKSRKDREIGKASSTPVELGSLHEIPCHPAADRAQ